MVSHGYAQTDVHAIIVAHDIMTLIRNHESVKARRVATDTADAAQTPQTAVIVPSLSSNIPDVSRTVSPLNDARRNALRAAMISSISAAAAAREVATKVDGASAPSALADHRSIAIIDDNDNNIDGKRLRIDVTTPTSSTARSPYLYRASPPSIVARSTSHDSTNGYPSQILTYFVGRDTIVAKHGTGRMHRLLIAWSVSS
jgi:hypothetical protein